VTDSTKLVFQTAPMSPVRAKRLPNWLKSHLDNIACHLMDRDEEIVRLQAELDHQEQVVTDLMRFDKVPAAVVDYSLRDPFKIKGRYDGDLTARLTTRPGQAYPYLVEVWQWVEYTEAGHANGKKDGWFTTNRILHEFQPEKDFKRLDKAIKHLHRVLNHADAGAIRRREVKRVDTTAVVLA
jgi:hypothetical protein